MAKIILLKLTSRERPEVLFTTLETYLLNAVDRKNLRVHITLDEDDLTCNNETYLHRLITLFDNPEFEDIQRSIRYKKSESKIHAINRDLNDPASENCIVSDWEIIVNASDDQRPQVTGWDNIVREAMPDHLDASIWAWDGHQDRISTMEIIGRKYYERFNYIYYPGYKSFFCDNESTLVAQKLGKQIKIKACLFKHFHPGWMNGQGPISMDDLYKRNDQHWKHDELLYKKRLANGFT